MKSTVHDRMGGVNSVFWSDFFLACIYKGVCLLLVHAICSTSEIDTFD